MRRRICALCLAFASVLGPWMTTVAQVPHPDHPGHVHGLS